MLNFWNLGQRLRPKFLPKEGQKVSKSKKFKILIENKKNYNKITTFCKSKQKITSFIFLLVFFGLDDPQKSKNSTVMNWIPVLRHAYQVQLIKTTSPIVDTAEHV